MDSERALFDPSYPAGWEPSDDDQPVIAIDHFIHRCDRLSWGPFERPITMALESISTFTPADKCFKGDFAFGGLLQSLWVDDPDVYAYAKDMFGLPVRLVQFNESSTPVQDGGLVTWTMTTEGATGEVRLPDLPGQSFQGPSPDSRVFWFNGQGISYVDWHADYKDDQLTTRSAEGTMPPPFLYGRSAIPDEFVARAAFFEQGSVHGPIQRFGDLKCEQPL